MIKGINNVFSAVLIITILIFSSCRSNIVYTESKSLDKETWSLPVIPSFKVPINDTLNSNNIIFTIRTGTSYPYRNIYLFVTTTSPNGMSITDTLQYNLADEKGNWYGKGFGDIHELDLAYKTNVYFPVKGNYVFNIQHGMRVEDLKGVYDFGIRVEKISK